MAVKRLMIGGCVMACGVAMAIAVSQSSLARHWLAASDGLVVVVDEPRRTVTGKKGDVILVDLRISNVTSAPVEILGMNVGCSCTTADSLPRTIAPHKTETLRLTVSLANYEPGVAFELTPEIYLSRASRAPAVSISVKVVQ